MKRSMGVCSMACVLAACGTDDPPARAGELRAGRSWDPDAEQKD